MKGYKPGRYQYLGLVIKNKKSQLCLYKDVYDESKKKSTMQYVCSDHPDTVNQKNDIMQRLNRTRNNLVELLEKKKKIKSDIEQAEHEILSLN